VEGAPAGVVVFGAVTMGAVTEGAVTWDVWEAGGVADVVPQLDMENVNMSSTASVMSSFFKFFLLFEFLF
jgi:hypothetical protein